MEWIFPPSQAGDHWILPPSVIAVAGLGGATNTGGGAHYRLRMYSYVTQPLWQTFGPKYRQYHYMLPPSYYCVRTRIARKSHDASCTGQSMTGRRRRPVNSKREKKTPAVLPPPSPCERAHTPTTHRELPSQVMNRTLLLRTANCNDPRHITSLAHPPTRTQRLCHSRYEAPRPGTVPVCPCARAGPPRTYEYAAHLAALPDYLPASLLMQAAASEKNL